MSSFPCPTPSLGNRRVLFVDDEPSILQGLRRMLRPYRNEWTVDFACSGSEALAKIEAEPFDVVVTDMRMPGMDGAQLLTQVRKKHPDCVRIVFSGHAEVEAALRAMPVAHQFLSKPTTAESIREVIARTLTLNALLDNEALRALVGSTKQLPARPEIYNQLTAAMEDPNASLADFARILERDVGMTAKILQLVNSSFFGLPRRVSSMMMAASYLGASTLRGIAASFEMARALGADKTAIDLDLIQDRSFVAAKIAGGLLDKKIDRDDAFTAAMLHKIGLLLVAAKEPDRLEAAMARVQETGESLLLVQQEQWGVTHMEIGAYLLGLWGLPSTIVEAICNCHAPSRVPHDRFDVVDAVHLGACLAAELPPAGLSGFTLETDHLERLGAAERVAKARSAAEEILGRDDA